jgi:hypothetical protein
MAFQIEYMNDAFPNHRARMRLFDRDGLGKRGHATVLGFDRSLKVRNIVDQFSLAYCSRRFPADSLPRSLIMS